mgnify:FL=1
MTTRQLAYMFRAINKRRKLDQDLLILERQFQATIHDKEYKVDPTDTDQSKALAERSKETDAKITAHAEKRLEELKQQALAR